jgi:hypothetical protein
MTINDKNGTLPKFTRTAAGRTKAGRLRELFDEIEAAKAAGWRYEYVILALREQALELTINTLKDALKRIRAERRNSSGNANLVLAVAPEKTLASSRLDTSAMAKNGGLKLSPEGYREPLKTFHRDLTKRRNWD